MLGLPVGDQPDSRPPQAPLPAAAKAQIERAYRNLGLVCNTVLNWLFATGPEPPPDGCGMLYR